MKKGVKIAIIVGVILFVIILAGAYLFVRDITERGKLIAEFEEIDKITDSESFDREELNKKTSNIVTTGEYATVEKAAKTYVSNLFQTVSKIREIVEDEKMTQVLTASNYEEDGPDFIKTKQYLSTTKEQLEEKRSEMFEYLEEEKINSYMPKEVGDYYMKLYQQLVTDDIEILEDKKKELDESINSVLSLLDTEEEIIDFLIANKGKWKIQVQEQQILFNTNELIQTYNDLLSKLQ